MNIFEFQAKRLLKDFGIAIPPGSPATSPEEAERVARELGGERWVVKAQIHAGARSDGHFLDSRGSGVRIARSLDAVRRIAEEMLNDVLVTDQTRKVGQDVRYVYVEKLVEFDQELYLSMLVDAETAQVTLAASASGGRDIERAVETANVSIHKMAIDPSLGVQASETNRIAAAIGLDGAQSEELGRYINGMYEAFTGLDASLIEINPLAVTQDGGLVALDAMLNFDDNALFRHVHLTDLRDADEAGLGEMQRAMYGLTYVKLDGNIGCYASGAGLALATIDTIQLRGGSPANFLNVPAVSDLETVVRGFKLILSDPAVESIVVNVFGGGIMTGDVMADGLMEAARLVPLRVPVVVRLAGANDLWGAEKLRSSGLEIIFAYDMGDAAEKAVLAAELTDRNLRMRWWESVRDSDDSASMLATD